jgi:signal transduction histidine kinase
MRSIRPGSREPYVDVMIRLQRIHTAAVIGVGVLMVASVWGRWTDVALTVAGLLVVTAANAWVTRVLLLRVDTSTAEMVRVALNVCISLPLFHMLHWPAPVWLYLPFTSLAFVDQPNRAVATRAVVIYCGAMIALGIYDGVPLMVPAVFGGFAAMLWSLSRVRRDVHEQMASALRQAQKLEAVGRLASGIAHEINTPLQYARDNVRFLETTTHELVALVRGYQAMNERLIAGDSLTSVMADARRAEEAADLTYLVEHAEGACHDSAEGLDRVTAIVASMRQLSHPQQQEMSELDLNAAIENVLIVARHEYQHVAKVETHLGALPLLLCHPGIVSQALLNVVVNAAHAIADAPPSARDGDRGLIAISSCRAGNDVVIEITDNGPGIPEADRARIFEPFFTTKDVGRGTGQGLAIARSVAEQHGGALTFVSEIGKGTTFSLRLPLGGHADGHPGVHADGHAGGHAEAA